MPSKSHVSRIAYSVLVVALAHFASEQIAFGQGIAWTPYRDIDRSEEQVARRVQQKQIRLPPPVRLAQNQAPLIQSIPTGPVDRTSMEDFETANLENQPVSHPMLGAEPISGFAPSSPAHLVIRSPATQARLANRRTSALQSGALASSAVGSDSGLELSGHHGGSPTEQAGLFHESDSQHLPPPPLHGQHSKLSKKKLPLGPIQPRQAMIPNARERATWKQPYSYGYFGSKSTRHWGTHHGYRDRYTEYRYR